MIRLLGLLVHHRRDAFGARPDDQAEDMTVITARVLWGAGSPCDEIP